ncbi:MAG TPA: VWA domain-containing protein, partial [Bryobacteraceae bacterium]|nr:VWA domain-containing protein [Bryobacteraceae bacterium]
YALIGALFALPGAGTWAQEAATTIAVDVKVVTLPVTVRDKHGKIVRDLTKDDFTLQEDGRPQTIKYFSQDANLPLTLGLLVDTSRSQTNVLEAERNASRGFLEQMLVQPKDKAFLIHFDREVELLQDLTSSREKLQAALDLLKTPSDRDNSNDPKSSDPDDSGNSRSASHHRGGTQLYDAVYLASNEIMKKQQGRKALIILTDGVDRGSKTYLEGAIEAAQRADTVIYSIYFAEPHREEGQRRDGGMGRRGGAGWPGGGGGWPGGGGGYPGGGGGRGGGQRHPEEPRADGKKILERISKETGGRFFEVTKKETVGEIYDSIVEEQRVQYNMGYTPDKDSSASGYHHIQLAVKKKDLTVQTRDGYYPDR